MHISQECKDLGILQLHITLSDLYVIFMYVFNYFYMLRSSDIIATLLQSIFIYICSNIWLTLLLKNYLYLHFTFITSYHFLLQSVIPVITHNHDSNRMLITKFQLFTSHFTLRNTLSFYSIILSSVQCYNGMYLISCSKN